MAAGSELLDSFASQLLHQNPLISDLGSLQAEQSKPRIHRETQNPWLVSSESTFPATPRSESSFLQSCFWLSKPNVSSRSFEQQVCSQPTLVASCSIGITTISWYDFISNLMQHLPYWDHNHFLEWFNLKFEATFTCSKCADCAPC